MKCKAIVNLFSYTCCLATAKTTTIWSRRFLEVLLIWLAESGLEIWTEDLAGTLQEQPGACGWKSQQMAPKHLQISKLSMDLSSNNVPSPSFSAKYAFEVLRQLLGLPWPLKATNIDLQSWMTTGWKSGPTQGPMEQGFPRKPHQPKMINKDLLQPFARSVLLKQLAQHVRKGEEDYEDLNGPVVLQATCMVRDEIVAKAHTKASRLQYLGAMPGCSIGWIKN